MEGCWAIFFLGNQREFTKFFRRMPPTMSCAPKNLLLINAFGSSDKNSPSLHLRCKIKVKVVSEFFYRPSRPCSNGRNFARRPSLSIQTQFLPAIFSIIERTTMAVSSGRKPPKLQATVVELGKELLDKVRSLHDADPPSICIHRRLRCVRRCRGSCSIFGVCKIAARTRVCDTTLERTVEGGIR